VDSSRTLSVREMAIYKDDETQEEHEYGSCDSEALRAHRRHVQTTFDIDGVSGAVRVDMLTVFKNTLTLNAVANSSVARLRTKRRYVVFPSGQVLPTSKFVTQRLGNALGRVRLYYVFGNEIPVAIIERRRTLLEAIKSVITANKSINGLWRDARRTMTLNLSDNVLSSEIAVGIICELFRKLSSDYSDSSDFLYIELYGTKYATKCATRGELFEALENSLRLESFPDCAVDICVSVGRMEDEAVLSKCQQCTPKKGQGKFLIFYPEKCKHR